MPSFIPTCHNALLLLVKPQPKTNKNVTPTKESNQNYPWKPVPCTYKSNIKRVWNPALHKPYQVCQAIRYSCILLYSIQTLSKILFGPWQTNADRDQPHNLRNQDVSKFHSLEFSFLKSPPHSLPLECNELDGNRCFATRRLFPRN
jgi:hypothetical protein